MHHSKENDFELQWAEKKRKLKKKPKCKKSHSQNQSYVILPLKLFPQRS